MSAELMRAYFERDLTEAEEAELGELLSASMQASGEFAAMAERQFRSFGLSVPSRPRFSPRAWGLVLAVGAGLAYGAWSAFNPEPEAPRAPLGINGGAFESEGGRNGDGRNAAPRPADFSPSLRVEADRARGFRLSLSPVQMGAEAEVLDARGRRISLLQAATPATWSWDGNDSSHRHVGPGRYEIRVSSGKWVVSKWVEVDKKP